jgi:hypothetical protein
MGYKFWDYEIPDHVMPGIIRYTEKHIRPGDFLLAVFKNNFNEAVARADPDCAANLKAFMGYLNNVAPSDCWGSPEKVKAWLEKKD